jgi:hypothetical protein
MYRNASTGSQTFYTTDRQRNTQNNQHLPDQLAQHTPTCVGDKLHTVRVFIASCISILTQPTQHSQQVLPPIKNAESIKSKLHHWQLLFVLHVFHISFFLFRPTTPHDIRFGGVIG